VSEFFTDRFFVTANPLTKGVGRDSVQASQLFGGVGLYFDAALFTHFRFSFIVGFGRPKKPLCIVNGFDEYSITGKITHSHSIGYKYPQIWLAIAVISP
jgi:hypothetical protein